MAETNQPIRLKVAKVLDSRRVVLNRGKDADIKVGERFLIFAISQTEIRDPDTRESLGFLEVVKGTGSVSTVQDRMSVLESDMPADENMLLFDRTQKKPFDGVVIGDLVKRVYSK